MVIDAVVSENAATDFMNKVIEDNDIGYLYCEKLNLELNKVTLELTSAKEIIEI
jgi:hypothetical protein